MIGPAIMKFGTEAQKRHYLPRILSAEDRWCQSRPNRVRIPRTAKYFQTYLPTKQLLGVHPGPWCHFLFLACRNYRSDGRRWK